MDKIFYNGRIYTMDKANPEAEAVAVSGDIIAAVGSDEELLKLKNEKTELIDLQGKMMIPGLIDAHCHPSTTSYFMNSLAFSEEMSLQEVLDTLREYVEAHPDQENYFGVGFNEYCFADREYTTELLDEICPDKPVFLASSGMHSGWANACAFREAGITEDTPDPILGFQYFGKNAEGKLDGHVVETEAENMIYRAINFFDESLIRNAYVTQAEEYNRVGVTTLVGCGNFYWQGEKPYTVPAELIEEDNFNVRLFDCAFVETKAEKDEAFEMLERNSKKYNTDRMRVNTYKIIMDGTFESGSASVIEEYVPGYEVIRPLFEGEEFEEICLKAASLGYDIHIHGIGNYAIHEALRGAEAVRKAGYKDTRFTVAHTQYVSKEDRKRFGELDVIANTTAGWHYWYPGIEEALGIAAEDEFTLKEIIDGGAIMTMGSDRPADEVGYDPRINFVTGVTRKYAYFLDDPEWKTLKPDDQKLTLRECLESQTVNAAHQIRMDGKLGVIKEGAYADLTVYEKDMFLLEPGEILNDELDMTVFNGKIVYKR